MFKSVDAAMLRAAVHPIEPAMTWPDLTTDDVEQWRAWLIKVWSQDDVADAIDLASPVLAGRVRELRDGRALDPRQVRRLVVSVTRYLLRMTSRATPFGLFAGVTPIQLDAEHIAVRWGTRHRTVARPDPAWLATLVARLEADPELRDRLPVVANDLCFVRGDRLIVPYQPHPDALPAEVSVRHTDTVADAIRIAGTPLPFADLVARLAMKFPGWESKIRDLVSELLVRRMLLSSLRPPMTAVDPLTHVVDQLTQARAEVIPQVAPLVTAVRTIRAELERPREGRTRAARRMAGIDGGPAPVGVDLRVDCAVTLPARVTRAAEDAAALLVRLNPAARGEAGWLDYQSRFLERYGPGAVVPVRDLVSDGGLGFPAGYRGSQYEQRPPALTDRDRLLLSLVQRATMSGVGEIALDEDLVDALQTTDPATIQVPAHTELSFQVHASTREAVDRGDFDLMVVAAFRAAGTTTGRFLHLLDPPERARVAQAYANLPTVDPDALAVQVSAPPLLIRTEQLARTPAVLPRLLSVGEHPTTGPERVTLDDLAVTGDARRLQLLSLSAGRPVEVTAINSVEFTTPTQPLVRFLCELSRARTAACRPFVWAAASKLPFLPRIRYGRLVLAPARWNLTPADVAPPTAAWSQWRDSLARWRQEVRLTDTVYVGGDDQRLRLDVAEDAHLHLLRAHLDRHGHATLHEAPAPTAYGWIDGHAHEIVLPLASTTAPVWPQIPRPRTARARTIDRDHGHMPGCSTWLHAKLYGHPDRQTEVLTGHLAELLATWPDPPEWWYLRYRDPDPHLRLRLRLPDVAAYGPAAARVGRWAATLRRAALISHLTFDSYQPETARYGSGPAMAAAERVFAADSAAALVQLAAGRHRGVPPEALSAASLTDLAAGLTGSVTNGMRWLVDNVPAQSRTSLPRDAQREAVRLANPTGDWVALRSTPGGDAIAEAWSTRRTALAEYRQHLERAAEVDPKAVLASLLHLHHIRMAGIDRDAEQIVHRLARAAALAWTVRTGRTPR